jgi:hypothetical protein
MKQYIEIKSKYSPENNQLQLSEETVDQLNSIAVGLDQNDINNTLNEIFEDNASTNQAIAFTVPSIGLWLAGSALVAEGLYLDNAFKAGGATILAYATAIIIAFKRSNNFANTARIPAEISLEKDLRNALISEGVLK